jgi:hypothetical protein
LVWAEPSNKAELASVVKLVDDPESGVRWKAMDFLARAAREQLEAALSYLEVMEPKSPHVRGLQWLLGTDASNPHEITTILQNQDKLLRKYGVVAARQISKEDREPLLYAASLDDPDVKGFADSSITLL